jgi:autonomous glycyl radical cofactor GrcA
MPKLTTALHPTPALKKQPLPAPVPYQSAKLAQLVEDRLIVAAKLAQLEARKKELDVELSAIVERRSGAPNGALDTGSCTVRITHATNYYTDRAKLLQLGVKASVIEKATTLTPYSYPRITKKTEVPAADVVSLAPNQQRKGR